MKYRPVVFMNSRQRGVDLWSENVGEMINTNLQALQRVKAKPFFYRLEEAMTSFFAIGEL